MKCMVNFEGISRISCALCGLVSCNDLCLIGNHLESIFSWNIFDDVGPWFWNSGIGFLEKNMSCWCLFVVRHWTEEQLPYRLETLETWDFSPTPTGQLGPKIIQPLGMFGYIRCDREFPG